MQKIDQFVGMTNIGIITEQIEICKRYSVDYRAKRGRTKEIVDRFHPKQLNLIVSEIKENSLDTKTIRFQSESGYLPPFRPGQYINLHVAIEGLKTSRAYAICSNPFDRTGYEITVKRVTGGIVSNYLLDHLAVGDVLTSSAPSGTFYRVPAVQGKRLVFIAGGSGITPFISMLASDEYSKNHSFNIDLIYGCNTEHEIIFKEYLDKLAASGYVNIHYVISNPEENCPYHVGYITKDLIEKIIPNVDQCTFYLCGPTIMCDFVTNALRELGVVKRRIRHEVESMPNDPMTLLDWPKDLNPESSFKIQIQDGTVIVARTTDTLLTSLENAKIAIPNICRSGECSACRLRLLSGKVYHSKNELLRQSDKISGYIHACATYPISNIQIAIS